MLFAEKVICIKESKRIKSILSIYIIAVMEVERRAIVHILKLFTADRGCSICQHQRGLMQRCLSSTVSSTPGLPGPS